jgi:hypothetical protein
MAALKSPAKAVVTELRPGLSDASVKAMTPTEYGEFLRRAHGAIVTLAEKLALASVPSVENNRVVKPTNKVSFHGGKALTKDDLKNYNAQFALDLGRLVNYARNGKRTGRGKNARSKAETNLISHIANAVEDRIFAIDLSKGVPSEDEQKDLIPEVVDEVLSTPETAEYLRLASLTVVPEDLAKAVEANVTRRRKLQCVFYMSQQMVTFLKTANFGSISVQEIASMEQIAALKPTRADIETATELLDQGRAREEDQITDAIRDLAIDGHMANAYLLTSIINVFVRANNLSNPKKPARFTPDIVPEFSAAFGKGSDLQFKLGKASLVLDVDENAKDKRSQHLQEIKARQDSYADAFAYLQSKEDVFTPVKKGADGKFIVTAESGMKFSAIMMLYNLFRIPSEIVPRSQVAALQDEGNYLRLRQLAEEVAAVNDWYTALQDIVTPKKKTTKKAASE